MLEHFDVVKSILHRFDYSRHLGGKPAERVQLVKNERTTSFLKKTESTAICLLSRLSRVAFALSVPHGKAVALREEIGFCQTVRGTLFKTNLPKTNRKTRKSWNLLYASCVAFSRFRRSD